MAAITSTASGGNASAGGSWVGGVAPVDSDTIVVAATATIVQDVNRTYGSNAGAVGHAVTINGTNASTFGTFQVASGVTLTLRGTDLTTNTLMLVNRFGLFAPQPGSTIVGDLAGDYTSIILNKGIITAVGTSGSHITLTSPAGNVSWANSVAAETTTNSTEYPYDQTTSVAALVLANGWIANAAGNGPGSFGDSSLSFSTVTPSGELATEVALGPVGNPAANVTSVGKYAVNYDIGWVYFYHTFSFNLTCTAAYKYLTTAKGWGIDSTQNTDNNAADFRYCDFRYMGGTSTSAEKPTLIASQKYSNAANPSTANSDTRLFRVRNCTFTNCYQGIDLKNATGTLADPILIDSCTFNETRGVSSIGFAVTFFRAPNVYMSVTNNILNTRFFLKGDSLFGTTPANTGFVCSGNTGYVGGFLGGASGAATFGDGVISGNVLDGPGFGMGNPSFDHRLIAGMGGTSGHPLVISGNILRHVRRGIHWAPYLTIEKNALGFAYHHGMPGPIEEDLYITGVTIRDNVFYGGSNATYNASPSIETGYNHRQHVDSFICVNNTIANTHGGIGLGDCQDNQGNSLLTRASFSNNLIYATKYGYRRATDTSTEVTRCHVLELDYNLLNGQTTAPTFNYNRGGTFSNASGKYNYLTGANRNVTGVALANPTYSTSQTGRTLALTVTSADANVTLSWGGGTAVQLIFGTNGTGTATAGANTTTSGVVGLYSGTLTNSGAAWSTTLNAAACPRAYWLKITGGTGSGQIRAITNNTATVLTVAPAWTTVPDATSTYAIYKSEVVLTDSGGTNTVNCGIYLPDLPTTTQSDTGITLALNDATGAPSLVNSSGTTAADYKITAGTAAIGAGTATNAPATDYFGVAFASPPSIGFAEFVAVGGVGLLESGLCGASPLVSYGGLVS